MRATKKEIRDPAVLAGLLRHCPVGRLGTVGADGSPMIKPLSFVYLDGDIYFHSAREGEKMDDVKRDARVCFEIDLPAGYVRSDASPCRAGYRYQSVIVKGRALVVEDRETRLRALRALMEKYQPEGGYGPFPEDKLALTAVVRIAIDHISGKQDLR
ncbi:MAG TPA: pyridoxamine 5'-phosphate oxidase family protein [Syntrophorhabdaceae bacterium]|nr:pyridoxamine 5'-phosphate oxidase family protein [Syntrophorhabdaceae bacterium]HOD75406.1 pyridoxamine 5'-phosphate oxidase family protein [Syntrophorhabdaceae bacterium]